MAEGAGLIERNASPRRWQMMGEGYYIWWKCLLSYEQTKELPVLIASRKARQEADQVEH